MLRFNGEFPSTEQFDAIPGVARRRLPNGDQLRGVLGGCEVVRNALLVPDARGLAERVTRLTDVTVDEFEIGGLARKAGNRTLEGFLERVTGLPTRRHMGYVTNLSAIPDIVQVVTDHPFDEVTIADEVDRAAVVDVLAAHNSPDQLRQLGAALLRRAEQD
jgi:hypothetical protein